VGWEYTEAGKLQEIFARDGEKCGCDRRIDEVFLCTLGAGSLLVGGFIEI
jgi:hypothetical protein